MRDALEQGAERKIAAELAQELAGRGLSWRTTAELDWVAVLPTCHELVAGTLADVRSAYSNSDQSSGLPDLNAVLDSENGARTGA